VVALVVEQGHCPAPLPQLVLVPERVSPVCAGVPVTELPELLLVPPELPELEPNPELLLPPLDPKPLLELSPPLDPPSPLDDSLCEMPPLPATDQPAG
jgi:hypothetical protein